MSTERDRELAQLDAANSEDFQRAVRHEITPDEFYLRGMARWKAYDPSSKELRLRIGATLSLLYARIGERPVKVSPSERQAILFAGELVTRDISDSSGGGSPP